MLCYFPNDEVNKNNEIATSAGTLSCPAASARPAARRTRSPVRALRRRHPRPRPACFAGSTWRLRGRAQGCRAPGDRRPQRASYSQGIALDGEPLSLFLSLSLTCTLTLLTVKSLKWLGPAQGGYIGTAAPLLLFVVCTVEAHSSGVPSSARLRFGLYVTMYAG